MPKTATTPLSSLRTGRLATSFSDPVLRILTAATAISSLGRGVFFTLTVLYFTFVVGLSTAEIAVILTVSSAVGVGTSMLGGVLADRFSARRLLLGFVLVEGVALVSYSFAASFLTALLIACVVTGANRAADTSRSAIIGRAFTGDSRVGARAILRTVVNVGISVGSAAASIPLLIDTPDAYRVTIALAGSATLMSVIALARLPRRVDAPARPAEEHRTTAGRSPWHNPGYLTLTVLSALFGIQFGLAEIGLPLWIVQDTTAPVVMVSVILIINTALVIALQIPFSRGTHDIRKAGNAVAVAGVCMAVACAIYAASAGVPPVVAIVCLAIASVAHAFGEILSSAGTWGLSYELADPHRFGAYLGLYGMAFSIGTMFTPAIITVTVIEHGTAGWAVLGVVFLGSALGMAAVARRASRSRPSVA